jgi:DNA repair protein RadD
MRMENALAIATESTALRPYQQEAVDSVAPYVQGTKQGNPIIVLPTGAGKTWVMAYIVEHFVEEHFPKKVLILSHVVEILKQNRATIEAHMGFSTAYYSAELNEKSTDAMIIVAGIQSIVRLKDEAFWDQVGLVIIDECHRVSNRNQGSYRKVLERADATCIGLTATPFRLGQGYLTDGKDALFTEISYNGGSVKKYNELVEQGYLTKIISKSTDTDLDVSKVKITAGDYNLKELSEAVDHNTITEAAIRETIKYGKKYKHWLVFAIDIEHAEHICAEFNRQGIPCGVVHSKMEGSRTTVIEKFKRGEYRALVNVEVLTTGFDFPAIDLVVMLRPTQSPVIHVQTVGRGARIADGKDHCLFLDFAGNTERLGPINNVYVKKKGERTSKTNPGILRTKICPTCGVYIPIQSKICEICNHKFIIKTKLKPKASKADIVAKPIEDSGDNTKPRWLEVQDVKYSIHKIRNNTDAFRVQYYCGLMVISDWVFFGRKNYAGVIAENWVRWRLPPEIIYPQSMNDLMRVSCFLRRPKRIKVDFSRKFKDVTDYEF